MKKFIALLSLSLLLAVSGCAGGTKPETQSATYPNIEDGTYEGTGSGYAGISKSALK